MSKAIFLDIDGVLNSDSSKSYCREYIGIDKDKVRRLAAIVSETEADIILTSTWKHGWQPKRKYDKFQFPLAKYLDDHMQKKGKLKIKDKTPEMFDESKMRGRSIKAYLALHPEYTSWVVLDDMVFSDYSKTGIYPHLVITDPQTGLTDDDAAAAIKILKQEATGPIWKDGGIEEWEQIFM